MRMLAMDIDGTCLNSSHRVSLKTLHALRMAAEAGIEIVPTTGRALSCLPRQLLNEPYIRYVISSNGAVVTDLKYKRTIYEAQIPSVEACDILSACKAVNVGIEAHACSESLVESSMFTMFGGFSYGRYSGYSKSVRSLRTYLEADHLDAEELRFYSSSSYVCDQMTECLRDYPGIMVNTHSKFMEVFADKATKGKAFSALAGYLGFRNEHVACVGDGRNDLTMFRVCGMKFAMGNAVEILKDEADFILPSNNRSGIAVAVERYLL